MADTETTPQEATVAPLTDVEALAAAISSAPPGTPLSETALDSVLRSSPLKPIGLRPPIFDYIRQMWDRRYFALELSRAREASDHAESRLGKAWSILNPLLNVAVYFLIFGVILKAHRSIPNYLAYLVIGVFFFTYTQKSIQAGAGSIVNNMALVRALHFPRALLPVSMVVEELLSLGWALGVCIVVVLATGEGISPAWLLLIPALLLQSSFNLGAAFVMARMTERVRDVSQLLPFLLRTWLYLSGVVFPLGTFVKDVPPFIGFLLTFNPGAVFVELARDALLTSYSVQPIIWVYGLFWAVFGLVAGFIYFWKAEERYGRG